MDTDVLSVWQQWHKLFHSSLHSTMEVSCVMVYIVNSLSPSSLFETPNQGLSSKETPFNQQIFSHWLSQVGHDGATPESCWLVEELTIVVPTKGVMYNFVCKCWLARDKGDGLTSRILNILDADCINVGLKVGFSLILYLYLLNGPVLV